MTRKIEVPAPRGGTRKIADLRPEQTCTHPEHDPPHCVFPEGVYEHVCPGCGRKINFTVIAPRL